jgi:hypothetical protein
MREHKWTRERRELDMHLCLHRICEWLRLRLHPRWLCPGASPFMVDDSTRARPPRHPCGARDLGYARLWPTRNLVAYHLTDLRRTRQIEQKRLGRRRISWTGMGIGNNSPKGTLSADHRRKGTRLYASAPHYSSIPIVRKKRLPSLFFFRAP